MLHAVCEHFHVALQLSIIPLERSTVPSSSVVILEVSSVDAALSVARCVSTSMLWVTFSRSSSRSADHIRHHADGIRARLQCLLHIQKHLAGMIQRLYLLLRRIIHLYHNAHRLLGIPLSALR